MALTLDQAQANGQTVGQLAASTAAIQAAILALQTAVSAEATVRSLSATALVDNQELDLRANIPMSVADTATIFNALIAVYQADLAAQTAQLQALLVG